MFMVITVLVKCTEMFLKDRYTNNFTKFCIKNHKYNKQHFVCISIKIKTLGLPNLNNLNNLTPSPPKENHIDH